VHLPFFMENYDLLPAFSDKIAEELVSPEPPGHILILLETGKALGLTKEEMFEHPASAPGRAISDYCRRVFQDGSIIELWGAHAYEETLAHWSKQWGTALVTHYGISKPQSIYFTEHAEADLVQHQERMGHGPMNRMILQRIVEQGKTALKLGYDPKYCAFTMVDLHALMEQHALENPYPA
jgi:pyrroloquinoline quinone (PQQ) biosynthesis protein C